MTDLEREREALKATLVALGPDAPTACGDWVTADLAVHVALGELFGGLPNAPFRMLVGHGIRIDVMRGANDQALRRYRGRGFDWALRRLSRPIPRVQRGTGSVGVVSLLELWAHHEDVLIANGLQCESGADLRPVAEVLLRYQRKKLEAAGVHVAIGDQPLPDLCRRLSGRAELAPGIRLSV